MRHTFRRSFTLLTPACLVALVTVMPAAGLTERDALHTLLVHHDRAPDGPARDQLAARVDALAHQKYATVSRLYWHIDLASATAAARDQRRPILHLRLLGRLDEDLSCANSRLFRATLYADQHVSRLLRDRFVLYWSSERPVPRVTIDYGDGRTLERTTTGNSAHYVLDAHGDVLDVLPGLYAPAVFRGELERSLALAERVRDASARERARLVADYQRQRVSVAERDWTRFTDSPSMRGVRQSSTLTPRTPLAIAQLTTMTKAAVELRDLHTFAPRLAPETLPEDQIAMWFAAGQLLYRVGGAVGVLDDASRALVGRLHNAGSPELRASDQDLRAMIARLERTIVADTALNQLRVRPQISREIVRRGGTLDFATLNAWVYARVFHTPKEDAWLGLLQRDVFTGLPGDGVAVRRE